MPTQVGTHDLAVAQREIVDADLRLHDGKAASTT